MSRIDDAIALAGQLAENGVARIEIVSPGGKPRIVQARITDLPGILAAAETGTQIAWPGGAAVVHADSITSSPRPRQSPGSASTPPA